MVKSFSDIDRLIKGKNIGTKVLSVAAAAEDHVIQAVTQARDIGIIKVILVGDEKKIRDIADENGLDLNGIRIIDCEDPAEASKIAVSLVRSGDAQILMKGLVDTSVYIKAVLDRDNGLRQSRLLNYVAVFETQGFDRLLYMTDPGINIEPTLEEKEIMMRNSVSLAKAMGRDCPNVAFISPIEKINVKMDSTLHAKAIKEKYLGSKDFAVDGPLALDLAVSQEAAKIKGVSSDVCGKADILIVNDIGVGNALYKSLVHFSGAKSGGIVLGASAPVLLVSRADSMETKLNSIKMGVLVSDYYNSI